MFTITNLPFEKTALEPYISAETIDFHYGKHHQTYVDNLNKLITWTDFENLDLETIIKTSIWGVFNNAAQVYNHSFYWECLKKDISLNDFPEIKELIERDFWSLEEFKNAFITNALWNFGSGWTWLVLNSENKLEIINTSNAGTILTTENKALLVVDVWEHAYYIDTRNARAKYLENFFQIINWEFVNKNLW